MGSTHIERFMLHMCYNIGISIIMIYKLESQKKNNYSFEDNQAHNVQCIST